MSEIVKTEAVVLNKIKYGETSLIVSLFTKELGLVSGLIKGGRSAKSKMSSVADVLNVIQIILYRKESRDLQLISSADLISYFPRIKEDLDSSKYAYAVLELIRNLATENESNPKLFKAILRILDLFDQKKEPPEVLFGRFFVFLLTEIGYELILEDCGICQNRIEPSKETGYSYSSGFICSNCLSSQSMVQKLNPELFSALFCLKFNKSTKNISIDKIIQANIFLERYLKDHIPDFKGIKSLTLS